MLGENSSKDQKIMECESEAKKRLNELNSHKSFKGCNINIECKYVKNPPSYAETRGKLIIIYIPLCLKDGKIGLTNTINHELVHAYDNCKTRGIIDCESMWYGELRGSYYGQCAQIKKESSRKECAIRGAKRSVSGNLRALRSQFGEAQMQLWKCYETEEAANNAAEKAYNQMKQDPNNPFE